jgi:membrane-bound ClpP family serine protease
MRLSKILTVLAILIAMITVSSGFAQDTVVLNDGTEVEGEIVRELDGNVWITVRVGTVELQRFYPASEIADVMRDGPVTTEPVDTDTPREPVRVNTGAPKGAVISLEGTVGIQMTAKTLRDILPALERELGTDGTGIVVFKINSGGGLLLEIQRLSDVIQEEYKPRFRTVAWIESAISAAAMTSHAIEEIYFMPRGNYGACTGWSGQLTAVSGRGWRVCCT